MSDEDDAEITQESVDAFVKKLQGWASDLPIEEQNVLQMMLNNADAAAEVEGHMLSMSFTPQILSRAVLGAADDTVDSWSKSGGGWIRLWGQTIPK